MLPPKMTLSPVVTHKGDAVAGRTISGPCVHAVLPGRTGRIAVTTAGRCPEFRTVQPIPMNFVAGCESGGPAKPFFERVRGVRDSSEAGARPVTAEAHETRAPWCPAESEPGLTRCAEPVARHGYSSRDRHWATARTRPRNDRSSVRFRQAAPTPASG